MMHMDFSPSPEKCHILKKHKQEARNMSVKVVF